MTAPMVNEHCALGSVEKQFLEQAFSRMKPSKRASHKILKIARTIADLAGASDIGIQHLAEAVAYRELDRKYV
jgi:magnesium chelatase family protein